LKLHQQVGLVRLGLEQFVGVDSRVCLIVLGLIFEVSLRQANFKVPLHFAYFKVAECVLGVETAGVGLIVLGLEHLVVVEGFVADCVLEGFEDW